MTHCQNAVMCQQMYRHWGGVRSLNVRNYAGQLFGTVLCLWKLVEFGDADRFRREHRVEDSLDTMRARRTGRYVEQAVRDHIGDLDAVAAAAVGERGATPLAEPRLDRKSTRLNSSH